MILKLEEIVSILESIKNQYPIGESVLKAFEQISDQAMLVNVLIEENTLLKMENEKLKLSK
jgi:regulator of replication initiation timing